MHREQNKFHKRKLYETADDGTSYTVFAGLLGRILQHLDNAGLPVEIVDLSPPVNLTAHMQLLTEEDLSNLSDRQDQVDVIGMVIDHPGGFIVQAPPGWGKSFVIGQICQVLPESRIAVVSPGKDITRTLYNRIKTRVSYKEVGMVGDGENSVSRITVCTMESISKLNRNHWDLLLFDEVHRAGGPATANSIAEVFHSSKCVGFSASPVGRTDGSDLVVEGLFGPVLYSVHYAEGVERGAVAPIKVLMYKINTCDGMPGATSVERNKYCLWQNVIRNSFIAQLVQGIPADEQALIIVDSVEHLLNIRALLPDIQVVFASMSKKCLKQIYDGTFAKIPGVTSDGNMLPAVREQMRKKFEAGELKRAIATGVWNTGVDFTQLSWLIRADGTASDIKSIQTPGRLSRTNDDKTHGVLVDFYDEFDSALRSRSAQRLRVYYKNKWDVRLIEDPSIYIPPKRAIRSRSHG